MKFPWTVAGQLLLILVLPSNTSPLLHTLPILHPQPHPHLLALAFSLSLASPSSFSHRQGILSESGDNHLQLVSSFPKWDLSLPHPDLKTYRRKDGAPMFPEDQSDYERVQSARISMCFGRAKNCHDVETRTVQKRRKRAAPLSYTDCEMEVSIEAFEEEYTLCLFFRSFQNEPILRDRFHTLNITIFQEGPHTAEIPLRNLELNYVAGYVADRRFSSVTGYIQNQHFFGVVHIEDHVHFLEPSLRRSKDLHMYLNGKDRLIYQLTSAGGAPACRRRQCELTLVADHHFYLEMGGGSLRSTLIQLLWHVKEANKKWATLDLDSDRHSDCLRLSVAEITIFASADSSVNLLTGSYVHPEDFLKRFSRYNFDGFCAGVLFTSRQFDELVLGLAWRGSKRGGGVGGVCQRRVRIKTDANAYSFNALFVSLRSSQEQRIPIKMGVLNLVHELLHSFGQLSKLKQKCFT